MCSPAVHCVAANLPYAARANREMISLPGGDPEAISAALREHLLACIGG